MLDLEEDWSISFAGCGFLGMYYVGACSCILLRCPRFIEEASKISGASAGALIAAALSVGIPLERCCSDLMFMAKEARRHRLGPLHPAYDLLHIIRTSLLRCLPEDAHVRASGKLCVSLTRVWDRRNVLVSEFDSREELIEALLCSCFVPLYCGVIPPTYRGVHYVDGAASDNQPRCHVKNTVTFSAYSGESDLCPQATTLSFHEVRFKNMSIQVNSENVYRVTSTFFPPRLEVSVVPLMDKAPQIMMAWREHLSRTSWSVSNVEAIRIIKEMAEICQHGYVDALRFLQENNLLSSESPLRGLEVNSPEAPCCESTEEAEAAEAAEDKPGGGEAAQGEHWWLDRQLVEKLPLNIRRALCEACRGTNAAAGFLSHVTEFLPKIPRILPVDSACSLAQRLVNWIPDVPKEVGWLYSLDDHVDTETWDDKEDEDSESSLRRKSLPSGLSLPPLTQDHSDASPEATPTHSPTFTWSKPTEPYVMPLTPPPTPTCSPASGFGSDSPQREDGGWGLGRAVGWMKNRRAGAKHQTLDSRFNADD